MCTHCLLVFPEQPGSGWVSEWTHAVLKRLREERDDGGEGEGLGYIGIACVEVTQGHWKDVCTLLETGTTTKYVLSQVFFTCKCTCIYR